MSPFDVVGLGIASLDFIGVAASEPTIGIKQSLGQWIEAGGGPVATALVALARWGLRTRMVTAVGDDGYGEQIIADLQGEGIATDAIQTHPGGSHVAFVLAEPGRDRRSVWWHNDPAVLAKLTVSSTVLTSARALLIDTHMPDVALPAARQMHAAGKIVMLDAERVKASTLELLPLCTMKVVAERFAQDATGIADTPAAAQALYERYGGTVVVTSGAMGSWCVADTEAFHTPAFAVDVVDTTGAGDVFHGGFLYGLLQGWDLRTTARFASAAAALKCQALGGRAGIPSLASTLALAQSTQA